MESFIKQVCNLVQETLRNERQPMPKGDLVEVFDLVFTIDYYTHTEEMG